MSDSLNFFNVLRPKILELITRETADCLRLAPYVISVPANPQTGLLGLTRQTGDGSLSPNPATKTAGNGAGKTKKDNNGENFILSSLEERGDPMGGVVPLISPRERLNKNSVPNNPPVIFVPFHPSLSTAPAGTSVLLVYRGNLCNAYALPTF